MLNIQSSSFLRRVLLGDALTCILTGLLMLLGARMLESLLGLPAALLQSAGFILLPIAGFIAYVGIRPNLSHRLVWMVIAGNALWIAGSIALLVTGSVSPTIPGQMFVVVQAVAVTVLAELEYFGLRRSVPAAA